ncbi:Os06g0470350, partial [Oryza sativa Japonica Group]
SPLHLLPPSPHRRRAGRRRVRPSQPARASPPRAAKPAARAPPPQPPPTSASAPTETVIFILPRAGVAAWPTPTAAGRIGPAFLHLGAFPPPPRQPPSSSSSVVPPRRVEHRLLACPSASLHSPSPHRLSLPRRHRSRLVRRRNAGCRRSAPRPRRSSPCAARWRGAERGTRGEIKKRSRKEKGIKERR